MGFDKALRIVEIIDEHKLSLVENLSEKLGHTRPTSGTFTRKLASLVKYGLVNRSGGTIELTPLAVEIVHPKNDEERLQSCGRAIRGIPLMNDLDKRLEGRLPGEDFWIQLLELTNVERDKAKEHAPAIRNVYKHALHYLTPTRGRKVDETEDEDIEDIEKKPPDGDALMPSIDETMILVQSGKMMLRMDNTDDSIDIIISALNKLKKNRAPNEEDPPQS